MVSHTRSAMYESELRAMANYKEVTAGIALGDCPPPSDLFGAQLLDASTFGKLETFLGHRLKLLGGTTETSNLLAGFQDLRGGFGASNARSVILTMVGEGVISLDASGVVRLVRSAT